MSPLKLISLNIEGDHHLDTVIPFLQKEHADVICLQEVLQKDVALIQQSIEMHAMFTPVSYIVAENDTGFTPYTALGLLVMSKNKPSNILANHYVGDATHIPLFDGSEPNACNRVLIVQEFLHNENIIRIMTTHFTWSPQGQPTPLQHEVLQKMFSTTESFDEFILCGDFNAPRGGPIWQKIAERYKDNIPATITTTIDQTLHKAKGLQYVVDGMFSTPGYEVSDVKVIPNISDHQAIVGMINRQL